VATLHKLLANVDMENGKGDGWHDGVSGGCDNPIRDNSVLSLKPLHLVIKR
jgi:hypothetical protein